MLTIAASDPYPLVSPRCRLIDGGMQAVDLDGASKASEDEGDGGVNLQSADNDKGDSGKDDDTDSSVVLIVAMAVGNVVLLIAAAMLVVTAMRKRRDAKQDIMRKL